MIRNAIVVMFDSLQYNYLGCYGNDWIKTPNIDYFAKEGIVFENAYCEGLPTVPCRRAMHTGRYTLPFAGWVALSSDDTTIADLCWGRPIDTALIFDCPMYRLPKFGYTRGFDKVYFTHGHEADDYFYGEDPLIHFDPDDFGTDQAKEVYSERWGEAAYIATRNEWANYLRMREFGYGEEDRYVTRTMTAAIDYLEKVDRKHSFFLWVDSFDPHEPWDPPSVYDPDLKCPYDPDYTGKEIILPVADVVEKDGKSTYTEEEMHHIRMCYAELITLCDRQFGRLMRRVRELGLEENTLVMVVTDHGEPLGMGEHGHNLIRKVRPWPYEELAHIVMIMRGPGIAPNQRSKAFVQSCDVAPTVCDWLGIGVHPDMQGKSLLPIARGEVEKVRDFAISGYYPYSWAMFTDEWSYIHWIPSDNSDTMARDFYAASVNSDHLRAVGGKGMFEEKAKAQEAKRLADATAGKTVNKVQDEYKKNASLDGAAQWTCTPGSTTSVPEDDALYDRTKDMFQLNNVISQYPEKAKEMFDQLRLFMSELRAS